MNNNKNIEILSEEKLTGVAGGAGTAAIASGSFVSQTGTSLNMMVSWSVMQEGLGQKTLYVTVSALSYALHSGALYNTLQLTVYGMTYLATPAAVNYDGGTLVSNVLAGFKIPNAVGPANITAAWTFNGVIGGVPVNTITASGVASF